MKETTVVLQCSACGAPLDVANAQDGLCRCKYCSYTNVMTRSDQAEEVLLLLHEGEAELRNSDFERAYNAFKSASELDEEESRAYFGMALATNKIKYIKDIVNKKYQPICFEVSDKRFDSDKNYSLALEYAETESQVKEYESRAMEIDYIREKFYELKSETPSYDTFICVKVSDGEGGFTKDSVLAGKLYDSIKRAGFNPFYSERDIGDRIGEDYEALILYALYSAKSFIIVCSNEEYLRTPWVQNEYTRYYSMLNDKEKSKNSIMIAFEGEVVERIPGVRGKIQGVDLANFDSSQKICEFVKKFAEGKTEKKNAVMPVQEEGGKYCAKCGTKNHEDTAFCSLCGDDKFVLSNEKYCVNCDTINTLTTKFCSKCGGGVFVSTADELEKHKIKQEIKRKKRARAKRISIISAISLCAVSILFGVVIAILTVQRHKLEDLMLENINITLSEDKSYYYVSGVSDAFSTATLEIPKEYRDTPITKISNNAFANNLYLQTITIPDSITSIGDSAFEGCSKLSNISIGSNVTTIGSYAFSDCAIETIRIPINVEYIGDYAFDGCNNLSIYCAADSKPSGWSSHWINSNQTANWGIWNFGITDDGSFEWIQKSGGISIISYLKSDSQPVIPSTINSISVVYIASNAFNGCDFIESVTIPESIVGIGNSAFEGCTNLTSLSIGNGVNTIGAYAFNNCSKLSTVSIGSNVTTIDAYAFSGCAIESISIPAAVSKIGAHAFDGCEKLSSIVFEDTDTWYKTLERDSWEKQRGGLVAGVITPSKNALNFSKDMIDYFWYKA